MSAWDRQEIPVERIHSLQILRAKKKNGSGGKKAREVKVRGESFKELRGKIFEETKALIRQNQLKLQTYLKVVCTVQNISCHFYLPKLIACYL